jgi:parvulin-like peptidyl-prolyl isomerase
VIRRFAPLAAAIIAIALLFSGCGRKKKSDVVALVNNQPITDSQLYDALQASDNGDLGRRTLDSLIVRQLIRQEADKRGLTVSREALQERLDGLKDYVLAATGKGFQAWLDDTGQTEQDLTSRISAQMLTAQLVFTQSDIDKYFEDNKQRLEALPHNNESVIYREIILPSKEEAESARQKLLAEAKEGKVPDEAFAKAAEDQTLDPVERRRGGMAGWVVKGKSEDPKLEKVLFDLPVGQVSEPIAVELPASDAEKAAAAGQKTPELYRLVMVVKHVKPGQLTLARNADVVEEWMLNDPTFQARIQEFFTNLRAKATIDVVSPRYKSLQQAYEEGRAARERRLSQSQTEQLVPPVPGPAPAQPGAPGGPQAPQPQSQPSEPK